MSLIIAPLPQPGCTDPIDEVSEGARRGDDGGEAK